MNKNWLQTYGGSTTKIQKFQQGGAMPAEQPAPVEGGEMAPPPGPEVPQEGIGDPQAEIEGMLMEYAQSRDPQLAVAVCDMLVEAMGAAAGAEQPPAAGEMQQGGQMGHPGMQQGQPMMQQGQMGPQNMMAPPAAKNGMKFRGPVFSSK